MIGEQHDVFHADPLNRLAATLNQDRFFQTDDALPPAGHWLFFLPIVRLDASGADGHAQQGMIDLPRRMWAGGRLQFLAPLRVGAAGRKTSQVVATNEKQGKSGRLVFVTLRHEIHTPDGLALVEEQDLVYREAGAHTPPAEKPAPAEAQFSHTVYPDPVLLFRYSALTFNSHRIHYDVDYCRTVEGYPGLVVHGPLIATLLLDQLAEHALLDFSFRAVSPLFSGQPFSVHSRFDDGRALVWALNAAGGLAMQGEATLA